MAVNWFEGGRRISALFQWAVLIAGGSYVLFGGGENTVMFETKNPEDGFHLTFQPCNYPDWPRSLENKLSFDGDPHRVTLCFRSDMGGVPYVTYKLDVYPERTDDPLVSTYMVGKPYEQHVTAYMDKRFEAFRADMGWHEAAEGSLWRGRLARLWQRMKEAFPWALGGAFAIWLFTFVIGWVARGFAGIPSGRDFRPA